MDEEQALRIVEEALDAALGAVTAPAHFGPALMRRVRERRVTSLPEILDAIGWLSVLAIAVTLMALFAPLDNPYWAWIVALAFLTPALLFGWRSLREVAD